jgi:hypothetical protein
VLDLFQELRVIAGALDAAKIGYALVGGLAVSIYSTPRTTKDIDLLISSKDMKGFTEALRPLGYQELAAPMTFAGGRIVIRRYTKLSGAEYVVVDVLVPGDEQLEEILSRRQLAGDDHFWVAPVDGLIVLKKLRGSRRDLLDIEALTGEPQ